MKLVHALSITLMFSVGPAFAHGGQHRDGAPEAEPAHAQHEEKNGHAAALGSPGDAGKVTRTVAVVMSDAMRFKPALLRVKKGETIRFVVKNDGRLKHEMVLGTRSELKEHAETMARFPEMEHEDPNAVTVEPGRSGELIWHFSKSGRFDFACLIPGHFEAGMAGKLVVR